MTPTASLRVLIVANACPWASWNDKIAAVKAFYAPLVALEIDIKQTDFENIPTSTTPGLVTTFGPDNTFVDTPGLDVDIDQTWIEQNILPIAAGYNIVVLQIANQKPQTGLPLGVAIGKLNGVSVCMTFVAGENDNYYLGSTDGQTMGANLGNSAEVLIEHEVSHELYNLSGQTDNTHKFFYSNQFARVLTDIKLPNQTALTGLYQNVIVLLEEELGIIKQQNATADMNTSTPTFPPKILAWAAAIKPEEGANPELHNEGNLKYSTLTASWGATKGPAAKDGGFLAQFKTDTAGNLALCYFLQLGCEDELAAFHAVSPLGVAQPQARTLGGFTKIYAGNPPQGYIDAIATAIGEPETVQISTFLS